MFSDVLRSVYAQIKWSLETKSLEVYRSDLCMSLLIYNDFSGFILICLLLSVNGLGRWGLKNGDRIRITLTMEK